MCSFLPSKRGFPYQKFPQLLIFSDFHQQLLFLARIFLTSLCHLNLFLYLYDQKYSSYSTCSTYFIIIFIGIYCILKSFKNEIHFECSPFFSNFFAPSPVSFNVDGLTPSSGCTFLYGVFLVFAIFWRRLLQNFFTCIYKEWHGIPF